MSYTNPPNVTNNPPNVIGMAGSKISLLFLNKIRACKVSRDRCFYSRAERAQSLPGTS
jgi:hypothetical protein